MLQEIFKTYLQDFKTIEFEDFVKEFKKISLEDSANFLKIGKVLSLFQKNCDVDDNNPIFKHLLKTIQINRTQALKHMNVYKYCERRIDSIQLTDWVLDLGIEKLYLISRLRNQNLQEKLERFVSSNKLTVKQLRELVTMLNEENPIMQLYEEFQKDLNIESEGGAKQW
jgi:hypothetical protein